MSYLELIKEFRVLCDRHNAPMTVKLEVTNFWESAINWAVSNNRIPFLEDLINHYPDQNTIGTILKNQRGWVLSRPFKINTGLKTLQYLMEKTQLLQKDENIAHFVTCLAQRQNISILQYVLREGKKLGFVNLKEKALIGAVMSGNREYVEKILKIQPSYNYDLGIDSKGYSITGNTLDDCLSETSSIYIFSLLFKHYENEMTMANFRYLIRKAFSDNKPAILNDLLSGEVYKKWHSQLKKRNDFEDQKDNYSKDLITPSAVYSYFGNYLEVLKVLKNNGIYEIHKILGLLKECLQNANTESYLDIIENLDFPQTVDHQPFGQVKNQLIIDLFEHHLKYKDTKKALVLLNKTELLANLNKNKFVRNAVVHQDLTVLDHLLKENSGLELELLKILGETRVYNTLFAEELIDRYVSIDNLRLYQEKELYNDLDINWFDKVILTKALKKETDADTKIIRKAKI